MIQISRNVPMAANQTYDVIIVGGGIYGISLSFEAARRGIKSLLLERNDFGGATTYNHLRIIHGGIRYLQNLDFHRFFESIQERKWFLRHFPQYVKPLTCLMPLYGKGLKRVSVLKAVLLLNDILSLHRNNRVPENRHLPGGKVVSPEAVRRMFPLVNRDGLQGGAIWYDAEVADSELLVVAMLKNACQLGTTALNYCEAQSLITSQNRVQGVIGKNHVNGRRLQFNAPLVINAAGPWCRQLACQMDQDYPELFQSSLALNILLDRSSLSEFALAVTPKKDAAQTYFARSWKGKMLVGTVHATWRGVESNPRPREDHLNGIIENLNTAIPGLGLEGNDILHVYAGLLPAQKEGSKRLAVREVILDHSQNSGPKGLFSVSGVKFTTARRVAEKTICKVFCNHPRFAKKVCTPRKVVSNSSATSRRIFDFEWQPIDGDDRWHNDLKNIIAKESVVHIDDLLLRRTNLGDNPKRALALAPIICRLFGWDAVRQKNELHRLKSHYAYYSGDEEG